MSHALAWQTTSRSFGRVKSERSQKVFGSGCEAERRVEAFAGARPCRAASVLRRLRMSVRSSRDRRCRRDERIDVAPFLRPDVAEQIGGNRTVRRHDVAVLLAQLHPDVGVQLEVERPHLIPEPIELLGELVGRHVVLRPPHRAGVGEAELARALCSTARRSARSPCASAAKWCASLPRPRAAASDRATSAITLVMSSMFRQVSGLAGSGHHLPLP